MSRRFATKNCALCKRPLTANVERDYAKRDLPNGGGFVHEVVKEYVVSYGWAGFFCTMRCGYRWAVAELTRRGVKAVTP